MTLFLCGSNHVNFFDRVQNIIGKGENADKSFLLNPFSNKPWFLHVCNTSLFKTLWEKEILPVTSNFSFFIRPSKTGRIMLSPRVGGRAGGVPHSLSAAYLQDYASCGYETSWVDRSHQGGVQCIRTITLTCLIFELLPFVYFHI